MNTSEEQKFEYNELHDYYIFEFTETNIDATCENTITECLETNGSNVI